MTSIRRAAVTGLFALWLAPLSATAADRAMAEAAEARTGVLGPVHPAVGREESREDGREDDLAPEESSLQADD